MSSLAGNFLPVRLPRMAADTPRTPDTYTVAEAAKVLGRTPKRVRQMLAEGKLSALPDTEPVRVAQAEVIALRDALRAGGGRPGPAPRPAVTGLTLEDVRALVEMMTAKALEASAADRANADAARDRAEQMLRDALAEERLKREQAEAEARSLRERLDAQAVAPTVVPRRRWFGR